MVELETVGEVTILRMVRGRGNALDIALLSKLEEALATIEASPARAAIITGQGSVFGAGVDLAQLLEGGEPYIREFLPLLSRVLERFAVFPKPVVAAVNGHAIAGGAIIMLACDQRLLATGGARIGLTEVQVGVPFPSWPLEIARYTTPREHFWTLVGTGRTWLPDEALARGLVDELVEPEQLMSRALEVARELGGLLPETFAAIKRSVRNEMIVAARAGAERDAAAVEAWCSSEVLARIQVFAERTFKRKG